MRNDLLASQTDFKLEEIPIEQTSFVVKGREIKSPQEKTDVVKSIVGEYIFNWHLRHSSEYLEDQFRVIKVEQLILKDIDLLEFLRNEYGQLPAVLFSIRSQGKNLEVWSYDPLTQILYINLDETFFKATYLDDRITSFIFHEFAHFILEQDPKLSTRYSSLLQRDNQEGVYRHESYTNALAISLLRKFTKRYPGIIDFETCRKILKEANKTYVTHGI